MRAPTAYADGLKLLARRELSEAEVRQRLARLGHDPGDIDAAVARLLDEQAIDDRRAAVAIARTESSSRHRGKLRVRRRIESAGIAGSIARQAVDEVFADLDPDALLDASLARRLRGGATVADAAEFQRLYRYLIGQGFEPERVVKALEARKIRSVE